MSTQAAPSTEAPIVITAAMPTEGGDQQLYRLSVDQYHRMIEAGIVTTNDRVELLDGLLIAMTPVGPPHAFSVGQTCDRLRSTVGSGWLVRDEKPITLATSEPEPDIAVVRGSWQTFKGWHPGPEEVGLLVEVANSSLIPDRMAKLPLYAAAGIGQVWLINLVHRQIGVYREPQPAAGSQATSYRERDVIPEQGSLVVELDGKVLGTIQVADQLP